MVLFFTATLGLSVVAMITLLAIKRYELASGRMFFAGVRPRTNAFFATVSLWWRKILPALARHYIERAAELAVSRSQLALAHVIVKFEATLERVLSAVRKRTEHVHFDGEPSAFLREVADHKKKLLHRSRNAIEEE